MTRDEAIRLAAELDLDVNDMGICLACLSFVSFAVDSGNEHKIRGEITRMTPLLWDEGLALPVQMALHRARQRGVANAGEALADVDDRGPRSQTVRAIVRRLAADLSARAQGDLLKMGFEPWPPPGVFN